MGEQQALILMIPQEVGYLHFFRQRWRGILRRGKFMAFDKALGGEKTCDCGRVWDLTRESLIQREQDSLECKCGRVLIEWNGAHHWIAKLVKDV